MVNRALLSVTDKSGLDALARVLSQHGYGLIASGGTASHLRGLGFEVTDVATVTGQPEILGGRVKTLHPAIAAAVLAPRASDLEGTGFEPIDVVVVNLYDFAGAIGAGADEAGLVESVDIGGPTLLRAAAKNFERVSVLSSPAQYADFMAAVDVNPDGPPRELRRRWAGEVFAHTSRYDAAIACGLFEDPADPAPPAVRVPLRYGENPHQGAWWSVAGSGDGLAALGLVRHGGKELSYNNMLDVVSALKLVHDLPEDACAILKHTNPCGVGRGARGRDAVARALACDPVSAFGGIVAFGRPVDGETADDLSHRFLEVVLAPGFDADARAILGQKKNLRWLEVDADTFAARTRGNVRQWGDLRLAQEEDEGFPELSRWQLAAGPAPTEEQAAACDLAWRVSKHVKSNAIVLGDATGTLGIGAGQMSRVDSAALAVRKAADAGLPLTGSVAASDGFFPFADGLEQLAEAGVHAIVQPGGSIRDDEVVAAADRLGITLFLTGVRHFRH